MRLAQELKQTEEWVRENISANELLKWQLYDRIHPFGDFRADIRAGRAADSVRGANGARAMGPEFYLIENKNAFVPEIQEVTDENVIGMFGLTFGE